MTLVVAQKTLNGILCISDTKITFEDSRSENPYYGALKSHILTPYLALHFAGDIYWANLALGKISRCLGNRDSEISNDLLDLLLAVNRESNDEVDFILVNLAESKISKISNFSCSFDCERAYIGCANAYRYFTVYRKAKKHELIDQGIDERFVDFSSMSDAFEQLVSDEKVPSVGGLSIATMEMSGKLMYQQKTAVMMGPMTLSVSKEPTTIPFGNAAIGSHSVNFLSSEPGDEPVCLGIHLHFGELGILWGPKRHIRPIVITNCHHDSLIEAARIEFGATIGGMRIS